MRRVSMNARAALEAGSSAEVEVTLFRITHPDLPEPIKLSTDNTEQISLEPLMYGTRSTWLGDADNPFLFLPISAMLPDDQEDTPPAALLVLEAISTEITQSLRSTTTPATVDMAVVLASSPNLIEQEWRGFKLMGVEGSASEITLQISRDPVFAEPWPAGRMTRQRLPGMHK